MFFQLEKGEYVDYGKSHSNQIKPNGYSEEMTFSLGRGIKNVIAVNEGLEYEENNWKENGKRQQVKDE